MICSANSFLIFCLIYHDISKSPLKLKELDNSGKAGRVEVYVLTISLTTLLAVGNLPAPLPI